MKGGNNFERLAAEVVTLYHCDPYHRPTDRGV